MQPDADSQHFAYRQHFAYHKRLPDHAKREKVVPIHRLLRMRVAAKNRPAGGRKVAPYKPKSASPYRMHYFGEGHEAQGEIMEPTYWQQYLGKLEEYHRKDAKKYKQDRAVFDDALAQVRKLCEDAEEFLPGIETRIRKDDHSSWLKRRLTRAPPSRMGAPGPIPAEAIRAEDPTDILRRTKHAEDELHQVRKELGPAEQLNQTFMTMIRLQATCVGARDPIQDSYDDLVEGLRLFHERFNIRVFIDDYLELLARVKAFEAIPEGLRPRRLETIDTADAREEDVRTRAELTQLLRQKYSAQDGATLRARTFILAALHAASGAGGPEQERGQVRDAQAQMEALAFCAEDAKRAEYLDTDRHRVESEFVHVIRGLVLERNKAIRANKEHNRRHPAGTAEDPFSGRERILTRPQERAFGPHLADRERQRAELPTADKEAGALNSHRL